MKRYRMVLSLSKRLHTSLMNLSEATGQPAASCVVEFLEDFIPQIDKTAEAVTHARNMQRNEALKILGEMTADATEKLSGLNELLENDKELKRTSDEQ